MPVPMKFNKHLHVVSFDVPYPADYGGAIDVYYKIKSLANLGIDITLHCYEYGRGRQPELDKICKEVYYYKRSKTIVDFFKTKPFIAVTRTGTEIATNIAKHPAPVLLEGLHTCELLNHPDLKNIPKIVRTHNVEHDYYKGLAQAERNPLKRFYLATEARKLEKYEHVLNLAQGLACISDADFKHFQTVNSTARLISAFHPNDEVSVKAGSGKYALFHGNLSVAENVKAVTYLLTQVLSKSTFPFIVTGKNPVPELVTLIDKMEHVQLIANPDGAEMQRIIEDAHVCLLPTFQATGLKLKLLHSLFSARHIITNTPMVEHTGLAKLVHVGDTAESMIQLIEQLKDQTFSDKNIEERKAVLAKDYSNGLNAKKLIELIQSASEL